MVALPRAQRRALTTATAAITGRREFGALVLLGDMRSAEGGDDQAHFDAWPRTAARVQACSGQDGRARLSGPARTDSRARLLAPTGATSRQPCPPCRASGRARRRPEAPGMAAATTESTPATRSLSRLFIAAALSSAAEPAATCARAPLSARPAQQSPRLGWRTGRPSPSPGHSRPLHRQHGEACG